MADYIFEGKTFKHPDKVINERVIDAGKIENTGKYNKWYLDREVLPKAMALVLDGPHDEIDWLKQEMPACVAAYNDFFTHCAERVKELTTSLPTG